MIRIMLVEDQELIRQSLSIVLSGKENLEIVGEAKNGVEAVSMAKKLVPDVILLDIRMPEMDGVAACRLIKNALPMCKIIVLTTFDDDEYVFNALRYGASGYLLKGVSINELVFAIKTVHNGGTLMNPSVASKLVSFFSDMANGGNPMAERLPEPISKLNSTENSIVNLIQQGLPNKDIAARLYLSEGTVRNNISSILSKLHLRDRTQIAIYSLDPNRFEGNA